MDNEISKKQFLIISIVVIAITLIVIISIVNSKNNNEIIDQENNNQTASDNVNVSDDEEIINTDENNDEIPGIIDEIEIEDNSDETNIDISSISENLMNLQNRIEVTTNDDNINILPEMINLDDDEIKDIIGVDVTLLEDYIIRVSKNKFDVDMYIIAKPTEANKDTIKTQINSFVKAYTNSWSKLGVEQYQLLEDIKSVERKGYLVYIVSRDNETLMNVVREFIK